MHTESNDVILKYKYKNSVDWFKKCSINKYQTEDYTFNKKHSKREG